MTRREALQARKRRIENAQAQNVERRLLTTGEAENAELRKEMLEALTWDQYRRTIKYFGLDGGVPLSAESIAAEEGVRLYAVQDALSRATAKLAANEAIQLAWLALVEESGRSVEDGEDLIAEAQDLLTSPLGNSRTAYQKGVQGAVRETQARLSSRGETKPSGAAWAADNVDHGPSTYEAGKLYHRTQGWLAFGNGVPADESPNDATAGFWWLYGWREAEAESGLSFTPQLTESRNLHGNHGPRKATMENLGPEKSADFLWNPAYARKAKSQNPLSVWLGTLPAPTRKDLTGDV